MENNENQIMRTAGSGNESAGTNACTGWKSASARRRGGEDLRNRGADPARNGVAGKARRRRAGNRGTESRQLRSPCSTLCARTVPASTSEMLAKHGIGDGPVDVRTLDAALAGLSLEQRIAVKSQLLRAGAIA